MEESVSYLENPEQPRPGTGTAFVTPVTTWIVTWQDEEGRVKHSDELVSEGMAVGWAVEQGAETIIVNHEDRQVVYSRTDAQAATEGGVAGAHR
jgi:uncharacterized protein YoaH (UPF0181 family)